MARKPTSSQLPVRHSLVRQTENYIRGQIAEGQWTEWVPPERPLCERLQVSRNTLRLALGHLAEAGLIQIQHGLGSRIVGGRRPAVRTPREHVVGLLTPDALEKLRPSQSLYIDELRSQLIERHCRLHVVSGRHYSASTRGSPLQKLLSQNPCSCWILIRCNPAVQAWFMRQQVPCVIAGSPASGVDLPSVDIDHRALCRHAAGVLLRHGHRNIAAIIERTERGGDIESEAGFHEGLQGLPPGQVHARVALHAPSTADVQQTVRRLMGQAAPPTALLVANPLFYLTVTSTLAQLGFQVPRDVSLICRDEDPFLAYLSPAPAHYGVHPHEFARTLLRQVIELATNGRCTAPSVRLMPVFAPGASIGERPTDRD